MVEAPIWNLASMSVLEPKSAAKPLRLQEQDLKGKVALVTYENCISYLDFGV